MTGRERRAARTREVREDGIAQSCICYNAASDVESALASMRSWYCSCASIRGVESGVREPTSRIQDQSLEVGLTRK